LALVLSWGHHYNDCQNRIRFHQSADVSARVWYHSAAASNNISRFEPAARAHHGRHLTPRNIHIQDRTKLARVHIQNHP
jgi:hypothetical protein